MPTQKEMIREAMRAIAQRKPGRSKLVYNKVKKTIVAVPATDQAPRGLNISSEDADMFGGSIVTITSDYLDEHWTHLVDSNMLPIQLSEWDQGDSYILADIGTIPPPRRAVGAVVLGNVPVSDFPVVIRLHNDHGKVRDPAYRCPDGTEYRATAQRIRNGNGEAMDVRVESISESISIRRRGLLETELLTARGKIWISRVYVLFERWR